MNYPAGIILQTSGGHETATVRQAALLQDIPLVTARLEELIGHGNALRAGWMPVGSVEFVRSAMRKADVIEPGSMSYPQAIEHLLRRNVHMVRAGSVLGTWFIKPCTTKAFNGFVFDTMSEPEEYDDHDREQYAAFVALPPDTLVWQSEVVRFASEWRYYVLEGKVVGSARYDQLGEEGAPSPDQTVVAEAVQAMADSGAPAAYSLDLGVLEGGETALVEANDAWALGCYGRCVAPRDYLAMLAARWEQLRARRLDRSRAA